MVSMMRVSIPLSNDGYFFASAATIGSSDDEVRKAAAGELTSERQTTLRNNVEEAMLTLARAVPIGRC